MAKHGKKYNENAKLVDRNKLYEVDEAFALIKKYAKANFDESVEVAFKLGIDTRHADQQIRNAMVLPHGTGVSRSVLVFAKGDKAKEAEAAGAEFVGAEDMVDKIKGGWTDFDVAIATPDMMGTVGKIGRILGPKGLMPNPKTGTVTMDVENAVKEVKAGKIEYRAEKAGVVHAPIGKLSFEETALVENFNALAAAIVKAKPASQKGFYVKSVTISTSMGPGIKLNPNHIA